MEWLNRDSKHALLERIVAIYVSCTLRKENAAIAKMTFHEFKPVPKGALVAPSERN